MKRPKRPALDRRALDVIAVPSFRLAPSGKTYGRGSVCRGSTRLSTNLEEAVDDLSTVCQRDVDDVWTKPGALAPHQPPIANISTLGRVEVAALRSSE